MYIMENCGNNTVCKGGKRGGSKMSRKFKSWRWLVLFAILACAALFNSAAAEEGSSYSIEGEVIRLVLDGFPNEHRREIADFRLFRTTENTEPLKFSLSDLVDEDGRLFPPRAMVFLTTPYDSNLQKTTTSFNQTLLLASEDEYADLQLVALYNEEIRAGTYRGRLISPPQQGYSGGNCCQPLHPDRSGTAADRTADTGPGLVSSQRAG